MKITMESTDKIVEFVSDGAAIQCRIWEGETAAGVKVHCYIPRVAVANGQDSRVYRDFETELKECRPASPEVWAIPLRLII